MADVTISGLPNLTPSANTYIPLSNGTTTGKALTNSLPGITPIGGIIMWSGTIASIPSGWALCNGATNPNGYVTASSLPASQQLIKAWANFDGTTGSQVGAEFRCNIRASYNIDRIVRTAGSGSYTVYFANALQDANYAVAGVNGGQSASYVFNLNGDVPLQTASAFNCAVVYPGNFYVTTNMIQFMVVR